MRTSFVHALLVVVVVLTATLTPATPAQPDAATSEIAARLRAGYPGIVAGIEANSVVFADGTTLTFDDGGRDKPFAEWLDHPDIEDMFRLPYPAGANAAAPAKDFDPGRARNDAFFKKVYGDCRTGSVSKSLLDVAWLPGKAGGRVKITSVNGVAAKLKAVSDELDQLPAKFAADLVPVAGSYNCRAIAGSTNRSAHGYGIAVDIALKHAAYWRWATPAPGGAITYHNAIPPEIVAIFEKHGFIWGGRWYHYDTMHFEYRPELLFKAAPTTAP